MNTKKTYGTLLSEIAVTRVYWKHQMIYCQDEEAGWCYYLKKGKVRVFMSAEDGSEKTIALYKNETLFGEAAFFEGKKRTTTAIAMEESEIVVISKEQILECVQRDPTFAWSVMHSLSQTIRLLSTQINQMSFLSAKKRLAQFLIEQSQGEEFIRCTQEELATSIGVSRVTISRELNDLKRQNIIEVCYGGIRIKEKEKLKVDSI